MRLWTLHPKYLDPQGLVALWREALLARAVLRGQTRGYRHHPQLQRFLAHPFPRFAINAFLVPIFAEAQGRGYCFDRRKVGPVRRDHPLHIATTQGQLDYEWHRLLAKLQARNPVHFARLKTIIMPQAHPLFLITPGPVETWERVPAGD